MEFDIKKEKASVKGMVKEDVDLAFSFSKVMFKEFGDLVKAIVLFGSHAKRATMPEEIVEKPAKTKPGDIDLLVIIDDVSLQLTPDLVETYRIIIKKSVADLSVRLHITSLKLSSFWAYIRAGDPVGLNILREGVALLDTGFFDPLKALLSRGMIRPSPESVYTYFARAPKTLANSKWHIMQAVVDLYWSVIDSAHAVLMTLEIVPPSPEHVSQVLNEKMVKAGHIPRKYVGTVDKFYKIYKQITRRELKEISGKDFDEYYKEAEDFVKHMKSYIESKRIHSG